MIFFLKIDFFAKDIREGKDPPVHEVQGVPVQQSPQPGHGQGEHSGTHHTHNMTLLHKFKYVDIEFCSFTKEDTQSNKPEK